MKTNPLFAIITALCCFAAAVTGAEKWPEPVHVDSAKVANVRDFGARGDCRRVKDGSMKQGSEVLTSATATFQPEDVGKPIYVLGAGSAKFPEIGTVNGAPLSSSIVAVTDEHTVRLKDAATQEVSGAAVAWGTDDSKAIQSAIDSLSETGGTVFFPPGMYCVVYQGGPGLNVGASNIRLQGSGVGSAIFNSTVIFKAKVKDGRTVTEQGGVPVLYVGTPAREIENVEVDHLWLGDNGGQYDFKMWGPHGPAVLGTAGKIDRVHFHDVVIETSFLCGVGMNSQTDGFTIDHVTVRSSGEHGFYLAGTGSHGEVHDNRVIGTEPPMRQGIVLKKKAHVRVTRNEISHVEFQALVVSGDDPTYLSRDILLEDNDIHDLPSWHTTGIDIFNADGVVIRGNRISNTVWIGINLHTWVYQVTNVLVENNVLTRVASPDPKDPCFAIVGRCDPPRNLPAVTPWPGKVADIVIANNTIRECPRGISMKDVSGKVSLRGNRLENLAKREGSIGYLLDPLAGAEVQFTGNTGFNYATHRIAPSVKDDGNALR